MSMTGALPIWLTSIRPTGRRKVSDIEFLAVKEFEGKLRKTEGVKSAAAGDLATLTANSGKDMYLAFAKISCSDQIDAIGTNIVKVELKANGTVIETFTGADFWQGSQAFFGTFVYEFAAKGIKVAATQIIKLEVISGGNAEIEGTLGCFEETTGDDPRIS